MMTVESLAASGGSTQAPSSTSTPPAVPAFMNQPTFIQKDKLKFLILDAPHYDNIGFYIQSLRTHGASDLVRTCERTYDEAVVIDSGITPHVRLTQEKEKMRMVISGFSISRW